MHPLSKVSRLEHAIGVAYITNLFLENTLFNQVERNNLLAAALVHDIGCAPFGHTVEWALNRYIAFDHEKNTQWVLKGEKTGYDTDITQMYYEQNLFYKRFIVSGRAKGKYQLDPDLILSYLSGQGKGRIVTSKSIDLDNIDNVFRMNLYLGLEYNRTLPIDLVRSFTWHNDELVLPKSTLPLLRCWLDARYKAYDLLIYNEEYVAYECMLSLAIETFFRELVIERDIKLEPSYWVITDVQLLQKMYEETSTKQLAKRLWLLDFFDVLGIYVSEKLDIQSQLTNANERSLIEHDIESWLQKYFEKNKLEKGRSALRFSVNIHCTTDFRKRFREILIPVRDDSGEISNTTLGRDKDFLVIAILTPWKLSTYSKEIKTTCHSAVLDYLRTNLDPQIIPASERMIEQQVLA
jgi:HD superfamily phosphohydrolase